MGVTERLPSGEGRRIYPDGATYTRVFSVLTSTYAANAATVSTASLGGLAIPAKYTVFAKGNDGDSGSVVTDVDAKRDRGNPLLWHITVTYTPMRPDVTFVAEGEDGGEPAVIADITDALSRVRIWWVPFTKLMERDVTGKLIANAAGQAFKPVFEETEYRFAVEISRYERTYNSAWFEKFKNKVNSTKYWGAEPKTLLMIGGPGGTRMFDEIGTYYDIRYQIHYSPEGWDLERINKGMYKRHVPKYESISKERLIRCTDGAGAPVTEDVLLDETGYKQLDQDADPIILTFEIKETADFADLRLPQLNITW